MAFEVGDHKEVELLLSFLECRPFILSERAKFSYIGDQILPARSALEFVRDDLHGVDVGKVEVFDSFIKSHPEAFNAFFAFEHAQVNRTTALENWVWDITGRTPEVPTTHWWWAPISTGEA